MTHQNETRDGNTRVVGQTVYRTSGRGVEYSLTPVAYKVTTMIREAVKADEDFQLPPYPVYRRYKGHPDDENREYDEVPFKVPPTIEAGFTQEHVDAWDEYARAYYLLQDEIATRQTLAFIFDGIHFDYPSDVLSDEPHPETGKLIPQWIIDDRDERNWPIPENFHPQHLKAEYLQRHVVGSASEYKMMESTVQALTHGFGFEDGNTAAAVQAMFRSAGHAQWETLIRIAQRIKSGA